MDEWIFDSIPYQDQETPIYDKKKILCYSATKFSSGRASAMKSHILPLIEKHKLNFFNVKLAEKILNQNYNFVDDFDLEKIKNSYYNNNHEIFWKKILTHP